MAETLDVAAALAGIGARKQTGKLQIVRDREVINLAFEQGLLIAAETNMRQERNMLGNMLLRAEKMTPEQLETVLLQQKEEKVPLGKLLIKMDIILEHELNHWISLQACEMVYQLFLTSDYRCNWAAQKAATPRLQAQITPIRTEYLVMVGLQQKYTWNTLQQAIPSRQTYFVIVQPLEEYLARSTAVGNASWDEESKISLHPAHLGMAERLVYSVIAPEHDVQKIIDLSHLGEFPTYNALYNLLRANIIGILSYQQAKKHRSVVTAEDLAALRPPKRTLRQWLWLLTGFALGLGYLGWWIWHHRLLLKK